ncbi:PAS domain-containing sensor histidine kinase [Desulforhopalus sp. IMCC35007]|uniref:PAS domain-containing hybrid sensor histidine kinase/response regulator n=1 Tax=Desulforhopalus sp. IMCC35007 TaxID=2569543 RepID=UPI0010ADCA6C|nr:PAS domain-containing sensor histidine kinase [Desulforhopalus sp. IMCC35007]TKB06381.1 PAS domain S-box protein [Desulforhopalus sp. IMCC35007]
MNFSQKKSVSTLRFYEAIISSGSVGMAVCDFSGQYLEVNNGMCQMVGKTRSQILRQNINSLDSWKQSGLLDAARAVIREKKERHGEVSVTSSTGKAVTVNYHIMPFVAEKQDYLLFIFNDISRRKQVEEQLRHSRDLMDYVISHARSAIAVHDRDLNYIYVSDRYLKEYKIKEEKVIGKHHYEVFPDLPQKWRDVHQKCLKGEVLSSEEDSYSRDDGSVDWTRWECRPWYESDGTIGGIIVYTEVITERKTIEDQLRKSQEQLKLAIEGSDLGLWDWNLQTGETFFNDKYLSMLGYAPTEHSHTKETWLKLLHPEDKKRVLRALDENLRNNENWNIEFRLRGKNGDYKWILGRGKVVEKDAEGNPLRASGTHLDISDRKRAEEDLLKLHKLESVGVLAGGIAHDFNNILVSILGNINLARLDSQLTPETQKLLIEAEKASFRAKGLTQQLLTFSKGGEPIKEAASLKEVVQDSAEFILHGEKSIAKYEFVDDLWLVEIDKGQISQVVQNIILNANQAMPDGGTIEIVCENYTQKEQASTISLRAGNYIKLSIKDCGVGIPANILGRIFDPYFSTKQEGSGLGLAITFSIIKKHNGHIQVESTSACGTIFTIFLPASTQTHQEAQKEKIIDTDPAKIKVMVMDDEEMVRNMSQAMLTSMGHETVLAKDGGEAVSLYKQAMESDSPIDLTIMDLTISGGMGGKESVKAILSLDKKAKVIVSSGYSTDPIMSSHHEYGFCGALVKPYQLHELVRAIKEAFTNSQK